MHKLTQEIETIVGPDYISTSDEVLFKHSKGQTLPKIVAFPGTDDQVSEILKLCNREKIRVSPQGSCTKHLTGNIANPADVIISTKGLNKVIEHIKDDMIVVTQSGILFEELQNQLRKGGQFAALDPPHIENGCTVGGIISTNDYGPLRQRYCSIKENILAMKFVRPDGKIVHSGAKVVKNVAGYDIHKFMVGTFGTLGIITEATLRLYPIPEYSKTLIVEIDKLDGIKKIIHSILNADFVLSSFELATGNVYSGASPYFIAAKIENVRDAVEQQVNQLSDSFRSSGFNKISIQSGRFEEELWRAVSNFPYTLNTSRLILRLRIPLSNVTDMFIYFEDFIKDSNSLIKISSSLGLGVVNVALENSEETLLEQYRQILQRVDDLHGYVTILESPKEIRDKYDVFGNLSDGIMRIMKEIKSRFDPQYIMNSGIFIGRI